MTDRKPIVYKKSIIISLVMTVVSFTILGFNPCYLSDETSVFWRRIGAFLLLLSVAILLVTEAWFNICLKIAAENRKAYLKINIVFSGLSISVISFMFLIYNTITYAVDLTEYKKIYIIVGVVLVIAYMMLQKGRLRREGVTATKVVSIISIAIVAIVAVYFHFEYIIYSSPMKDVSIIKETVAYATLYTIEIAKHRALLYMYIFSTTPLFIAVLMNYIDLLVKSKKLEAKTNSTEP